MSATRTTRRVARRKPAAIAAPSLRLDADRPEVKAGEAVRLTVRFGGLDSVELELAPKKGFAIDLRSLSKPGVVHLRGKRDGTTTVIASGRAGGKEVVRKLIHLRCEGPKVRILAFGYIPKA